MRKDERKEEEQSNTQSPTKLTIEIRDEPESAELGGDTRQITEGDAPYGSESSP